jgi:mono/diheme cytochrome c family protein
MNMINKISMLLMGVVLFSSCNNNFDNIPVHEKPRWEFAPQMYHSEAYEPVSQIVDSIAYGEHYNTSPGNKGMNLREPVAGTIKRGFTPYKVPKDSLEYAAAHVVSPLKVDDQILAQGEVLYKRYCQHCHGASGKGDGPVSEKFMGIANIAAGRLKDASEGHIFHVITAGKGMMLAHASQISQEDRWKITHYVKEKLQKVEE